LRLPVPSSLDRVSDARSRAMAAVPCFRTISPLPHPVACCSGSAGTASIPDPSSPRWISKELAVSANMTLAACAAGLTAMFTAYLMTKKWEIRFTVNGFLAGLVAITSPCYWVSPTGSIILGAVAGVIVVCGVELLEYLRIDDPIGAVHVHGVCGIWGTLSLGLFAVGKYGATGPTAPDNTAPLTGLFYGGGVTLLKTQFIGSAIITVSTFAVAMLVMWLVNLTGTLRVSAKANCTGSISTSTASSPIPSTSFRPLALLGSLS